MAFLTCFWRPNGQLSVGCQLGSVDWNLTKKIHLLYYDGIGAMSIDFTSIYKKLLSETWPSFGVLLSA